MAAILFLKLALITIRLTFLAIYIFCANLMNLAGIFQVSEHLNDFEIIDYCSHFVFHNNGQIVRMQNIFRSGLPMGCF